jgi:hypothetical protein
MIQNVSVRTAGTNAFDELTKLRREAFSIKVDSLNTGKHWYRVRLTSATSNVNREIIFRDIGPNILTVTPDDSMGILEVVWRDSGGRLWTENFIQKDSPTNKKQIDSIYEVFYWEPQHQSNLLAAWNSSGAEDWWQALRTLRGSQNLTFMVEEFYNSSTTFIELGTHTVGYIDTTNGSHLTRIKMHVGNELAKGVYFLDREPVEGTTAPIPQMPEEAPTTQPDGNSFGKPSESGKYKIPPMPDEQKTARKAIAGWWGTQSNGKE